MPYVELGDECTADCKEDEPEINRLISNTLCLAPAETWEQIDTIHQRNTKTGEIKLKVSDDFKKAILECFNDSDFRAEILEKLKR